MANSTFLALSKLNCRLIHALGTPARNDFALLDMLLVIFSPAPHDESNLDPRGDKASSGTTAFAGLQSANASAMGRRALATPIQSFTRGELIFDTSEGNESESLKSRESFVRISEDRQSDL